jgi:orotidine-5'-phosphate decarboxylase
MELQSLAVEGGKSVSEWIAASLRTPCDELRGPGTGWSSLGVVVGATRAASAEQIRAALPKALFLVPGFGAQGGTAADAVRGFTTGPSGLEGGIVNASRSVLFGAAPETDARSWERGFDARLGQAIDTLAQAVQR